MFKIKTSLIQGFAALLISSSSLWATPHHDDDNVESFELRGMEAPAIQGSASGRTSPSTSSTSTDLSTTALDLFVPVTVSEGVIASAARQSTDLVTSDKVWPPKWSPIEDENALANLPRLVLNEIFQWLLWTGDVDNVKNATFINRYWHRYTQSMEFKNLFLNGIQEQVGDDSSDAPGHPAHLFKAHRTYFRTYENRKLIEFFKNKTFAGALEITAPAGMQYRTAFDVVRRVAHKQKKHSLSLQIFDIPLSPTVHFDLGKLTCLNLKGNKLKLLPDLARMTNLQALNLESNDLMELPHLGTLTNLKALLLKGNFFTEIPGLSALSQLKALDVSDNPLAHLEGLENLSELREMTACWDYTNYYNIPPCRTKPERNAFTNLSALEHLTALKTLRLEGFMVSELPPLTKLTNLQLLFLENLGISEVPGLEDMTQLRDLVLSNGNYQSETMNIFTSLPNLSRLQYLEYFYCNNVGLSQSHPLELLTNLEDLELARNKLTSFNGLEKLGKLDDLSLSGNPLDTLPDLRNLQRLGRIKIDGTPLTALQGLDQLTSLRSIWRSDNHARAPEIMSSLDRLTQLQALRNVPVLSIYSPQ